MGAMLMTFIKGRIYYNKYMNTIFKAIDMKGNVVEIEYIKNDHYPSGTRDTVHLYSPFAQYSFDIKKYNTPLYKKLIGIK